MQKIAGLYKHRGEWIFPFHGGWYFGNSQIVYKTLLDVKEAINRSLDSSNKIDPKVIGFLKFRYYDNGTYEPYFERR